MSTVTVWAIVVMLQREPQIFEFSVVVPTKQMCEDGRTVLKGQARDLYDASLCIEMKLPKQHMKKGGEPVKPTPPSRTATKPVV